MLTQMKRISVALAAVMVMSASAFGAENFTKAKFEAAQSAGKSILIDIYAPWCPVCKAQQKVIAGLKASKYKALTVFKVDFDNQKDVVRSFGARQQSTLIAFRGKTEGSRLAYTSDADQIEAVVKSAF